MASQYARTRNFDLPGHDNVSRLSPFLRHRLLLESEVIEEVLDRFAFSTVEKFVDEVCWRTYWKGWLEMHPQVWEDFLREQVTDRRLLNSNARALLDRACRGESGLKVFDHWVNEMFETGYLHNHARMWFASIWIFTLKLPWSLGASFFLRHLLDGDPATNTLSWRWVAGLQTKGKAYVARASNIAKYTDGRFNPAGKLNESPELIEEDRSYHRRPLPAAQHAVGTLPSLSDSPCGLLVTDEDLCIEHSEFADCPFSSIAVLDFQGLTGDFEVSAEVRNFRSGALKDAAHRLAHHWDAEIIDVKGTVPQRDRPRPPAENVGTRTPMRLYHGNVDNWARAVATWASREHLKAVRMFRPPTGFWSRHMPALRAELAAVGVRLHEHRRRWDSLHWPHATSGFFSFKRNLNQRLRELGIE